MKKLFITTSILFALIVVGSLIASCTEGGLTTTITPSPGGTPITVTPTFTTTPPEIPHVYIIEEEGNPYIWIDRGIGRSHMLRMSWQHTFT